jgi:hypothetical protein
MTAPQPSAGPAPTDAGTGAPAAPEAQPATITTPPAAPVPTAPAQPTTAPGAQPVDEPSDVASLPKWAQKAIAETRAEAAKYRTEKQTAAQQAQAADEQRNAVLKAMGINSDGTDVPPDAATLTAQIEQANSVAWASAVELQVFRSAKDVDASALLDSRKFVDTLDQFVGDDPGTPDFAERLTAHIATYVEAHPQYRAAQAGAAPAANAAGRLEAGGRKPAPANTAPKTAGEALALAFAKK